MKKFQNLMQRGLAAFMSLTLAVGTMSFTAFAAPGDDAPDDSNVTYEVTEIIYNDERLEGETFKTLKKAAEQVLNGGEGEGSDGQEPSEGDGSDSQEPSEGDGSDSQKPSEGEGSDGQEPSEGEGGDSQKPGEGEGGDSQEPIEEPEDVPQTITLPVDVWIRLENHATDNLTTGKEENIPAIEVTYTYERDGETVTGSYVCNEENGEWVFDQTDACWKFRNSIEIPKGVTSVKFTQSNYEIDQYIITADGDHKDIVEKTVEIGDDGHPRLEFANVYCLKSHADVSVEVGGVTDENGNEKEIKTDEDGKQIVDYKPGDVIQYKVTVTNDGADRINHMLLTVTLPEGLEFVNWGMGTVEGFNPDGSENENFKGVYDYWNPPSDNDYSGFAFVNGCYTVDWTYGEGSKGETTVKAGTYILQIGMGYGNDPLSEVGSSITVTLLAKVISEIESGDLELKAEGTTIIGIKDDATVVVYAPEKPENPPVIVITPTPDPDPIPDPTSEDPPVDIDEPDVPLGELPDEDVEIDEPEIPLEELPEIEIDEPDVPLDGTPQTGDASVTALWAVMFAVSLAGAAILFTRKERNA